jgi:hypothetical protein
MDMTVSIIAEVTSNVVHLMDRPGMVVVIIDITITTTTGMALTTRVPRVITTGPPVDTINIR